MAKHRAEDKRKRRLPQAARDLKRSLYNPAQMSTLMFARKGRRRATSMIRYEPGVAFVGGQIRDVTVRSRFQRGKFGPWQAHPSVADRQYRSLIRAAGWEQTGMRLQPPGSTFARLQARKKSR